MKSLPVYLAFSCLGLASSAFSKDLLPDHWLESVPATDGSQVQSLVFKATAGVLYTVQISDDLQSWEDREQVYGLGQQFVAPMRRTAAPPPPDPSAPPPAPHLHPSNASLCIARASGESSGIVVCWASLDDGGARCYLIPGIMDPAWNQVPLFAEAYGSYSFFISHAGGTLDPPESNPALGEKDAAMIADLESNLAAMNQHMVDATWQARNSPPPAAEIPGSKRFFRIRADWSADSDGDGIPDPAEFELMSSGSPDAALGDPFNGDKNNDGIADGKQADSDGDGTPDADDSAPADPSATAPIGPIPRYAAFGFPGRASAINRLGTVLLGHSTWKGGQSRSLAGLNPEDDNNAALGINDSDQIVGQMTRSLNQSGAPAYPALAACYWPSPTAGRLWVEGEIGGVTYYALGGRQLGYPGTLSEAGVFSAATVYVDTSEGYPRWTGNVAGTATLSLPQDAWQLPATGGGPCTMVDRADELTFIHGARGNLKWGEIQGDDESQGRIYIGNPLTEPGFIPQNVVRDGRDPNLLFAFTGQDGGTYTSQGGGWAKAGGLHAHTAGISFDGVAIGYDQPLLKMPILINSQWHSIERTAPGLPDHWKHETSHLVDISANGWILGNRTADINNPDDDESAVLLPTHIKGQAAQGSPPEITGVDDMSVRSSYPDLGSLYASRPVKDRLWIMAPASGGVTQVILKAPLNSETPLKLSASGIKFGGADELTLTEESSTFAVTASDPNQSGQDIPLTLKFGDSESLSKPIGVKVMKARTVKVTVHPVASIGYPLLPNGHPDLSAEKMVFKPSPIPTKAMLEAYLNQIYKPQVNVSFDVTVRPLVEMEWDKSGPGDFDPPLSSDQLEPWNRELNFVDTETPGPEEMTIHNALEDKNANLNIYLLAGCVLVGGEIKNGNYTQIGLAAGIARPKQNMAFVDGSLGTGALYLHHIIAHEIGHCMIGFGHPEEAKGPAPLLGVLPVEVVKTRLMFSDSKNLGCRLVKAEWDSIETWIQKQINDEKMPP